MSESGSKSKVPNVPPLERLVGLETEYAIRFSPSPGSSHPGNRRIYEALTETIGGLVPIQKGSKSFRDQWFTENGGAFYYESLPYAPDGGLIEGATPECRGPGQLLLYQKALDQLLIDALPETRISLSRQGYVGELGLLKNCRDAEGHVYGAQENYEATVASGWSLWMFRLGLVMLCPLMALSIVLMWLMLVITVPLVLGFWLIVLLLTPIMKDRWNLDPWSEEFNPLTGSLGRVLFWVEVLLWLPTLVPLTWLINAFAFRHQRQAMLGFLVSRAIFSGAGTVDGEQLGLSEKGPAVRHVLKTSVHPDARAIFDPGNLLKPVMFLAWFNPGPWKQMFQRRQRLQLGLSDSNMVQFGEYLKVGTTTLVLDMAEANWLHDAPRLAKPVQGLHTLIADPTLKAHIPLKDGGSISALELQRYYLNKAETWLADSNLTSLDAREVVRLWKIALDTLESDPSQLVGRVDWVTKRFLLESCADTPDPLVLKKIDLRYHELGIGYLTQLEQAGATEVLVTDAQTQQAMHEPPSNTPARVRSALMQEHAQNELPLTVSWDSVRIGGRLRGRIIRLDDYRN